jgi:hypothetical protein
MTPITANELAEQVRAIVDPQARGRQYVASYLARLAGTRAAGFVLTRDNSAGKWAAATYVLSNTPPAEEAGHRTHKANDVESGVTLAPMSPMCPTPDASDDGGVPPGAEAEI